MKDAAQQLFVQVAFEDGDYIHTRFNGSMAEAAAYYEIGKVFNLGSVTDRMVRVTGIKIITRKETP